MKNYKVTVNGTTYNVEVEEVSSQEKNNKVPPAIEIPSVLPNRAEDNPKANLSEGDVKVEAPMPGKILNIKLTDKAVVKTGEVILILEAMKMENEVVAPKDGTIVSINVSVGETVDAGTVLFTIN